MVKIDWECFCIADISSQLVSYRVLCLDLIIHHMSALVRSNPSHFRVSGDSCDLVYAVLLLYIGPAMNSPWRTAYQEQTHISPLAPKCRYGRWCQSQHIHTCTLTYKCAESAFVSKDRGARNVISGSFLRARRKGPILYEVYIHMHAFVFKHSTV